MRLRTGVVLVAAFASWALLPAVGRAGWITLTSGLSGSLQPTDTAELRYGSSATPPLVAIDALSGTGTVQALTGGGTAYFTGFGVPVLLNLSDGSATLAGGSLSTGVTARGPDGTAIGSPASAAPQAGVPIPDGYSRLGLALAPGDQGAWVLTASVLGGEASSSVIVPEGGWWILGLGASSEPTTEPPPVTGPGSPPSSPPGVPEPATVALAASGAFLVLPWLRRKKRAI